MPTAKKRPDLYTSEEGAKIQEALKNINPSSLITLITDGGPENNLKTFLSELSLPLEHRKALIDIQYSNSLIEAHNKILKYNYLYRMDIPDGERLKTVLPKMIEDFNNRPHISLQGLTPNEAEKI